MQKPRLKYLLAILLLTAPGVARSELPLSPLDFDESSAEITNTYFPKEEGMRYAYEGYNNLRGRKVFIDVRGAETIDDVMCRVVEHTFVNAANAVNPTECYAQDISGNVWLLRNGDELLGLAAAELMMSGTPAVGDVLSGGYTVEYTSVTFTLDNGDGPYSGCVQAIRSETADDIVFYPEIGELMIRYSSPIFGSFIFKQKAPIPSDDGNDGDSGGCFLQALDSLK